MVRASRWSKSTGERGVSGWWVNPIVMWSWNVACIAIGYLVATSVFSSPGLSSGAQGRQDASSTTVAASRQLLVLSRLPIPLCIVLVH